MATPHDSNCEFTSVIFAIVDKYNSLCIGKPEIIKPTSLPPEGIVPTSRPGTGTGDGSGTGPGTPGGIGGGDGDGTGSGGKDGGGTGGGTDVIDPGLGINSL